MDRHRRRKNWLIESLETRRFLSAAQLIRNGGFEGTVSSSDWVTSGNFQADSRFTVPHTGVGYAYLATVDGNTGNSLTGSIEQQFTIPSTASSLTLSFWRRISTSETSVANDTMTVSILDSTGTNTLQTVTTLSNLNSSTSYVQQTFSLNRSLIGQTVQLMFSASTNATLPTTFRVDDVSLNAVSPATSNRVVGYFPEYEYSALSKIDFSAMTHVNYFQIAADTDGTLEPGGVNTAHLDSTVAMLHAMGITVSITVGPQSFVTLSASATARANFATNIVNFALAHNLDGVDIDWEPPAGNNYANYGLLIDALYAAEHPQHMLITAAVNPITNEIPKNQVNTEMDWINVMCYDFSYANHSTYADATSGMVDWTNYGVTKNKLVMGMPFYGRQGTSWSNTSTETYTTIASNYLTNHGALPAPDLDLADGWYYNGVETMRQKAQYVVSNGYGGAMIWELSQDQWNSSNRYDTSSLLPVIKSVIRGAPALGTVTPSPADNSLAPLNGTQMVNVTVNANVSGAGVLEVSLVGPNATTPRDWFYVSAAGNVSHTFSVPISQATTGSQFYEVYTQFRPNVTSGPFTDVDASDSIKISPYHLNWKQFPVASNIAFDVNARHISVTASENLASTTGDAFITPTGASAIDIGPATVSGTVATFSLPSNLPDGSYTFRLPAASVHDSANNAAISDWTSSFGMLTGDANQDGHVDSADFTLLAQNFNKPGMNFAQGDFNYDGKVNALDFNILATKFGSNLPSSCAGHRSIARAGGDDG